MKAEDAEGKPCTWSQTQAKMPLTSESDMMCVRSTCFGFNAICECVLGQQESAILSMTHVERLHDNVRSSQNVEAPCRDTMCQTALGDSQDRTVPRPVRQLLQRMSQHEP